MVWGEDDQSFNFGAIDVDFGGWWFGLVSGGGRGKVELLEQGDGDCDEDEDVYGAFYDLGWVALIHIYLIIKPGLNIKLWLQFV